MTRNPAFWPKEGVRRQIPGLVNCKFLDAEVTDKGVKIFRRLSGQPLTLISWEAIAEICEQNGVQLK